MRTIYIDSDFKCHVTNADNMTAVETDFFDGKCDAYIEGYRYNVSNGYVQIYPWKPYGELDAAQRNYELEKLREYEESLKVVGVTL